MTDLPVRILRLPHHDPDLPLPGYETAGAAGMDLRATLVLVGFVVGFGIKTPERASEIAKVADGVVVGSAIVERIGAGQSPAEVLAFVKSLADAAHAAKG